MSALIQLSTELTRRRLNLAGFRSRWVQTTSGRMHWLDASGRGPGPAVVLLHGLSSSAVHFAPILSRLRSVARRVIAIDLPGHGASDRSSAPLTTEVLWDGFLRGLDAIEVAPFVLVGSSLGGFAAVRYAVRRDQRVRGLVLCSPGGAPLPGASLTAFKQRFALSRHADGLSFVDAFLAGTPPLLLRHALAWGVRQTMAEPGIRSLVASVGYGDLLRPEELSALAPAVYLIWGQADRLLPESCFRFFEANLPGDAWIERPVDFGHTPYLEQPGPFVDRLKTFLRERV
ncbi:MAG: alpha/beta hydrolase [Myxococcota bacterium]